MILITTVISVIAKIAQLNNPNFFHELYLAGNS
jgi:hypothetical protein